MDEWLMQEPWTRFFEENDIDENSVLSHTIKMIGKLIKSYKKKKRIEDEEEIGSYYNVCIYRVMPYPPGTKDVNDSYVQRTG